MSFEQQQQQQQGGAKGAVVVRDEASCVVQASSGDSGSTLKAHDYIGLSEVTSMPLKVEKKNDNKALPDLNLGETELRLGPPKSPPVAAAAGSGAGQGASVAAQLKDAGIASKNQGLAADGPPQQQQQQQKWHEKLASGSNGNAIGYQQQQKQKQSSQEQHNGDKNHEKNEQQQAQQQVHEMNAYSHAVAAAMAAQKNNNNNTVAGAKRGFSEAIGNGFVEGRSVMPSIGASGASSASQNGKNPLMPSMYPWSASKQLPVAWRMGLEQSKGSFGPFPSSQPMKDAGASRENTPQNAWDSSSAPASKTSNGGFGLSSSSAKKNKEEDTSDEVAPSTSPPVVGWPPVQSFRKNTLAAHPPPAPQKSTATTEVKTSATVASVPAAAPSSASAAPTASNIPLFVKVYMDGVPIGRKVDLKAHNSYEKLSSVLEEMFHRFITGQNGTEVSSLRDPGMSSETKKLNFLHGSEFVLTYEDKDGDLMLVGDVPWGMFTGTVKRLRIMKGSEAIGLAPPQAAADKKVACQG